MVRRALDTATEKLIEVVLLDEITQSIPLESFFTEILKLLRNYSVVYVSSLILESIQRSSPSRNMSGDFFFLGLLTKLELANVASEKINIVRSAYYYFTKPFSVETFNKTFGHTAQTTEASITDLHFEKNHVLIVTCSLVNNNSTEEYDPCVEPMIISHVLSEIKKGLLEQSIVGTSVENEFVTSGLALPDSNSLKFATFAIETTSENFTFTRCTHNPSGLAVKILYECPSLNKKLTQTYNITHERFSKPKTSIQVVTN